MKLFNISAFTLIFFTLFYCPRIEAFNPQFNEGNYQVGDVLLLDLDCFSCQFIEDETFGSYSHSGVIVEVKGKKLVAQSLSKVHHLEIKAFLNFSKKEALHLRPKNINNRDREVINQAYSEKYFGLLFDHDFLWDNGTLYCSEFIYLLLAEANILSDLVPAPMNFTRNWDFWKSYFHKEPPQGQLGLSPNDFFRSEDFYQVK